MESLKNDLGNWEISYRMPWRADLLVGFDTGFFGVEEHVEGVEETVEEGRFVEVESGNAGLFCELFLVRMHGFGSPADDKRQKRPYEKGKETRKDDMVLQRLHELSCKFKGSFHHSSSRGGAL